MQKLNRITPGLPVQAMQTYEIIAPVETHFRSATCQEVDCADYQKGWATIVDESDPDRGQMQAHYIRRESKRSFRELRSEQAAIEFPQLSHLGPGLTVFIFAANQQCFTAHQTRIDRPEFFTVSAGDWRARLSPKQQMRPDNWTEHMNEGLYKLQRIVERG